MIGTEDWDPLDIGVPSERGDLHYQEQTTEPS